MLLTTQQSTERHALSEVEDLYQAVRRGDRDSILTMIESGIDLDRAAGKRCLLEVAYRSGNQSVLEFLIERSVRPKTHDRGREILFRHPRRTSLDELVQMIIRLVAIGVDLEERSQSGDTALHHAIRLGDLQGVNALLRAGAKIESTFHLRTPLGILRRELASSPGRLRRWGIKLPKRELLTPELYKLMKVERSAVDTLVESLQAEGTLSPETIANRIKEKFPDRKESVYHMLRIEVTRRLSGEGEEAPSSEERLHAERKGRLAELEPKVAELCQGIEVRDGDQLAPIHEAAQQGDLDRLNSLLEAGASARESSRDGWQPIHFLAATNFELEVVDPFLQRLLAGGVTLEARQGWGGTPLHVAVAHGSAGTVQALLKAGADPNASCRHGPRPLHLLSMMGEIADPVEKCRCLLAGGADASIRSSGHPDRDRRASAFAKAKIATLEDGPARDAFGKVFELLVAAEGEHESS